MKGGGACKDLGKQMARCITGSSIECNQVWYEYNNDRQVARVMTWTAMPWVNTYAHVYASSRKLK